MQTWESWSIRMSIGLALSSENGEMFGEEYTLVAVADYVLKHTPGNTVSNLSSSRALKDVTEAYGQQYHAAAVGEVNVVAEMKRTHSVIGGEGNGGVIYPESHYGGMLWSELDYSCPITLPRARR